MALEHMVWLTPKPGVSEAQMDRIASSIRALTHIPGVIAISADVTSPTAQTARRTGCW
jgi:hypothetical protein